MEASTENFIGRFEVACFKKHSKGVDCYLTDAHGAPVIHRNSVQDQYMGVRDVSVWSDGSNALWRINYLDGRTYWQDMVSLPTDSY